MGVHDWIGVMALIGGVAPWGCATLAGSGRWDWFMGARDIGWIRVMGLIHGGSPWGHVTLAGSGWWDWFIGARHGGKWLWLDRGDGFDSWGLTTLARLGNGIDLWWLPDTGWNGAMALIYGDTSWGCATGSGKWDWFVGHTMGVRHWLDVGDGIELWGCAMGTRDWIGAVELICRGAPWGRTTLTWSGRWNVGVPWGARHWLDWGDGIDLWERAKWQSTIWLLNLNDDAMCPHVWRWGKCAKCIWLRGW